MNQAPNRFPDQAGDLELGERGSARHALLLSRQLLAVTGGVLTILLVTLAVQMLAGGIVSAFFPSLVNNTLFLVLLSGTSMYLIGMPFSYFLFRMGKRYVAPVRGRLSVIAFLGALAISFGIALAGSYLAQGVQGLLSRITGETVVNPVHQMTSTTPMWANLLTYGLLGPIMEELFYRRIVIDRLRPFGDVTAVVASGLIFGLVHGNLSQVFYTLMFGIFAGLIYVYTGKLRYTVALHIAVNMVGGVLAAELDKLLALTDPLAPHAALAAEHPVAAILYQGYLGWMILCAVVAPVAAALLLWRYRRAERTPACMSPRKTLVFFVKNPGVVALAAMLVLLFLI